jgi:hypothetical protein
MNSGQAEKWRGAGKDEIVGLDDMKTWEPVRPIAGMIPIDSKWVFKVKYTPTGEIEKVEDATDWVINLVKTYLSTGITPDFLKEEAEKVESWQQNLTLQNQDLARRSLELEARREQIEALEESLKRERNGREQTEQ